MKRQKRLLNGSSCGLGCLGTLVLIAAIISGWYSSTGKYQPKIPPLPPLPNPNAFNDYVAAGQMLKANGGTKAMYITNAKGMSVTSLPGEQAVVRKNQAVLARMRQGFGKACRVPTTRSFNDLFPYLAEARDLARLLSAEADVKAARGDYAGAFDAGLDTIQMGQDLARGGTLIHGLVTIAMEAIAHAAILKHVDKLSAADCDRLATRLESVLKTQVTFPQILQEESYFSLTSLSKLKGNEAASLINPNEGLGGEETPRWQKTVGGVYWHYMRDRTLHELEDYYGALQAEMQKPYAERKPVPEPKSPIAAMIAPVFSQANTKFDETDMRNRLLVILLKVRSYRLKQGQLPASLNVVGSDPAVTTDPFSAKPFVYKPQGGDYLLYSVGPNLKDDGGIPADEMSQAQPRPGDLGIRRFQFNPNGTQSQSSYRRVPHMKPPTLPPGAPPLYP